MDTNNKNAMTFQRGDIVSLHMPNSDSNCAVIKQYDVLKHLSPDKLLILRQMDERTCLVAVCRAKVNGAKVSINVPNLAAYIYVKFFYPADISILDLFIDANTYDSRKIINEVYDKHSQYVQASKEKSAIRRVQKKQARSAQKKKENKYKLAYEAAVLNNDKEKMKQIVEVVGYEPGQRNVRSSGAGGVSYSNLNPKPLNGGRFSPR